MFQGVLFFTLYNYLPAYYEGVEFPGWVDALGWLIGITSLVPLPVCAVYQLFRGKYVCIFIIPDPSWPVVTLFFWPRKHILCFPISHLSIFKSIYNHNMVHTYHSHLKLSMSSEKERKVQYVPEKEVKFALKHC